ncbi:MAG: hypothetical protein OXC26_05810, partial [Albidovulum sp.]|nr:hypothetical protein [Albidovulum sp.]
PRSRHFLRRQRLAEDISSNAADKPSFEIREPAEGRTRGTFEDAKYSHAGSFAESRRHAEKKGARYLDAASAPGQCYLGHRNGD